METESATVRALQKNGHTIASARSASPVSYSRTLAERFELVKQFGSNSLAYATLQSDRQGQPLLRYFDTPEGYVAYQSTMLLGAREIVLGEPICHPTRRRVLLRSFIKTYPNAVFVQVGEIVAGLLEEMGYFVNRFGVETFLDLKSYTLAGRSHEDIRTMLNRATRGDVRIEFIRDSDVSLDEVEEVNREWMGSRTVKSRELAFMVRPAVHTNEPYVRRLYAYVKNQLVGFAYYDPMFRDGRIIGYHAMTNRFSHRAPRGTSYLLDVTMMRQSQEEGLFQFALGFSPFSQVGEPEQFRSSWLTKVSFSLDYTYLNSLYNFKGQELRKRKYRGRVVPLYFASHRRLFGPLLDLMAVCRVSNFSISAQVLQRLKFN